MSKRVVKQKNNDLLSKFSDEELVELSQEDIDSYRMNCSWECSSCGHKIPYLHSLYDKGNVRYLHEYKCNNMIKKKRSSKKCNTKMHLIHNENKELNSIYFDELFARFQNDMIRESANYDYHDSFEEVYSSLLQQFMKIVTMFNRDSGMKKTSDKWFRSFFWRSIKNRIVDIRKSESHSKRSPQIECMCCGKPLPYISPVHLLEDGHDDIWEKLYEEYGRVVMSGDISSSSNYYHYVQIGKKHFESLKKEEKNKIFSENCMRIYSDIFPNSYTRNIILSTNEPIDESGVEIGDLTACGSSGDFIESIYISDVINFVMDNTFSDKESLMSLDIYFSENFSIEEKRDTIKQIIRDKVSYYNDVENSDLDSNYIGVQKGLTEELFKMIREDSRCMELISKECKI